MIDDVGRAPGTYCHCPSSASWIETTGRIVRRTQISSVTANYYPPYGRFVVDFTLIVVFHLIEYVSVFNIVWGYRVFDWLRSFVDIAIKRDAGITMLLDENDGSLFIA